MKRIIFVTVCVLALAGCSGTKKDAWAGRGSPVPVPNEPSPSPPAEAIVTGVGGVLQGLRGRVIAAGGLVRPVSSGCDATIIVPSFSCHITYLGQVVTYQVTTEATGTNTYNWRATPDVLVATRAGIQAAMWRKYSSRATAMSCDTSLPDQQRVKPGATLGQRCYFKPTSKDEYLGRDSDNDARTVAVEIVIRDGGIGLNVKTQ